MVNVLGPGAYTPESYGPGVSAGLESSLSAVLSITLQDNEELALAPEEGGLRRAGAGPETGEAQAGCQERHDKDGVGSRLEQSQHVLHRLPHQQLCPVCRARGAV